MAYIVAGSKDSKSHVISLKRERKTANLPDYECATFVPILPPSLISAVHEVIVTDFTVDNSNDENAYGISVFTVYFFLIIIGHGVLNEYSCLNSGARLGIFNAVALELNGPLR